MVVTVNGGGEQWRSGSTTSWIDAGCSARGSPGALLCDAPVSSFLDTTPSGWAGLEMQYDDA